jgi:hypothetical protein
MKPFGPPARTVPVADVDDGRGRSALAFASGTDGAARRVELAVRRRGRKELASRTDRLSRAGTIEAVAVSVGASGAVLTAWVRDGRIEARIRTRKGELRPVQRLATGAGIRQLHADLGEDGRAVVAWRERTLLSKVSGDVQNTVRAAVSGRKGRFARARLLDTFIGDQAVSGAGVRALAQRDRQLVAWNGSARARAAFRRRAGFGAPVELEPTDAVYRRGGGLEDLVARGGSAIAVYVAMSSTYSVGPAIEHRIDVASRPAPVVR